MLNHKRYDYAKTYSNGRLQDDNFVLLYKRTSTKSVGELFMKRIIALSDAEDDTVSLFRVLRYTRFRLQTLQEAYLMNGEGEKCVGVALCY